MPSPAAPLLEAQELTFHYGQSPVLRGVSLRLDPGDFLALAGPNGAGKTTLLHLLTGHLTPESGQALLRGENVAALPRREVAAQIGYVPQRSESVYSFRVVEMVLMGRQPYAGLAALDSADDCRIALEALEEIGLAHLADHRFDQLSGGEAQLVLIARALAQQAPILVLDEPTTFLDLKRQWQVTELLAQRCQGGQAIVATFHDLNLAARRASRLALLHDGQIAAIGPPEAVLLPETLERVYQIPLRVESRPGEPPRVDLPW